MTSGIYDRKPNRVSPKQRANIEKLKASQRKVESPSAKISALQNEIDKLYLDRITALKEELNSIRGKYSVLLATVTNKQCPTCMAREIKEDQK